MKKAALLIAICLMIFSCNKEEIITEEELAIEKIITKTYVYENETYTIQLNSEWQPIESNINKDLLNAISFGNVVSLKNEDLIYLFDSVPEMEAFIKEKVDSITAEYNNDKKDIIILGGGIAKSIGYEHVGFNGSHIGGIGSFQISDLYHYGANDVISSFQISNHSAKVYVAQYFEHPNYQGRVCNFILSPGETRNISDLRHVGFNDLISSMIGRYLTNYTPHR